MKKVTVYMDYDPDICPIRHVLSDISDKWSILVISALKGSSQRFSELRRAIPDVSQRMLTQTLRKLERDGYVARAVTPTIPPRVDYDLTDLGRDLCTTLAPLSKWALDARADIQAARKAYDTRADEA